MHDTKEVGVHFEKGNVMRSKITVTWSKIAAKHMTNVIRKEIRLQTLRLSHSRTD